MFNNIVFYLKYQEEIFLQISIQQGVKNLFIRISVNEWKNKEIGLVMTSTLLDDVSLYIYEYDNGRIFLTKESEKELRNMRINEDYDM